MSDWQSSVVHQGRIGRYDVLDGDLAGAELITAKARDFRPRRPSRGSGLSALGAKLEFDRGDERPCTGRLNGSTEAIS